MIFLPYSMSPRIRALAAKSKSQPNNITGNCQKFGEKIRLVEREKKAAMHKILFSLTSAIFRQRNINSRENQTIGAAQTLAAGTRNARSTDQKAKKETVIKAANRIY